MVISIRDVFEGKTQPRQTIPEGEKHFRLVQAEFDNLTHQEQENRTRLFKTVQELLPRECCKEAFPVRVCREKDLYMPFMHNVSTWTSVSKEGWRAFNSSQSWSYMKLGFPASLGEILLKNTRDGTFKVVSPDKIIFPSQAKQGLVYPYDAALETEEAKALIKFYTPTAKYKPSGQEKRNTVWSGVPLSLSVPTGSSLRRATLIQALSGPKEDARFIIDPEIIKIMQGKDRQLQAAILSPFALRRDSRENLTILENNVDKLAETIFSLPPGQSFSQMKNSNMVRVKAVKGLLGGLRMSLPLSLLCAIRNKSTPNYDKLMEGQYAGNPLMAAAKIFGIKQEDCSNNEAYDKRLNHSDCAMSVVT